MYKRLGAHCSPLVLEDSIESILVWQARAMPCDVALEPHSRTAQSGAEL